jgi:hypothetical protein
MRQPSETPDNNYSRGEPEHTGLVDDVPPTASDWAHMARAASDAPGRQAAAEYNKNHQSAAKIELQRLRYLTDNYVSLKRAWSELNDQRRRGEAAATTVEALMPTVLRDERRP